MKARVCFLIAAALLATGCSTHYYKMENNTLRVYLRNTDAREVLFSDSLHGFRPRKARKTDGETWEIDMPGNTEFRYYYLVDGDVFLPPCKFRESDDFGSENCIFVPNL